MKIIISPAKKMILDMDTLGVKTEPALLKETRKIFWVLKAKSLIELKDIWTCSDKLAEENYVRLQDMSLERGLTPAILAYEGLQYQHMAPRVMSQSALDYCEQHLRILSGFYGVLKPFDGVTSYRLEMQAKLSVDGKRDLYDYWGQKLYQTVMKDNDDRVIINLASKEYSQSVQRYIQGKDVYLTIEFGELIGGKIKQKGTLAKMARGEMVRFLAEKQVNELEEIKQFCELGFRYRAEMSSTQKYVFVREKCGEGI